MASHNGQQTDDSCINTISFNAPSSAPALDPLTESREMSQTERLVPAGLKALCEECSRLYPEQPNPLQVTTRLKYWLGGQDPLDYISMYWNPGRSEDNVPPHWHYISFGLSDLHGDGRVHPPPDRVLLSTPEPPPSGYGLELTFRLAAEPGPAPPLWPAALLQALARYIFTTGNKFYAGDHISWHAALDGTNSRVRHLLVAEDHQLKTVLTAHGTVNFLQMVGCTPRELRAAQRGSGFDVLNIMKEDTKCGGSWLVTRSGRVRSCRVSRASLSRVAPQTPPAPVPPAPLAGVTARLAWRPLHSPEGSPLPASVQQQIKETLQRGLTSMSTDRSQGHMSTDSFELSSIERALPDVPDLMQGSWREDAVEYLSGVHLTLNAEGASLLPLAIDGRVRHGRHFTWRGARAATALGAGVRGALASPAQPYAAAAGWLQMYIPQELAIEMSAQVAKLANLADTDSETDSEDGKERDSAPLTLPLTLSWPKYHLKITVVPDSDIL